MQKNKEMLPVLLLLLSGGTRRDVLSHAKYEKSASSCYGGSRGCTLLQLQISF